MKECPKLVTCPFFNDKMANTPASSAVLKTRFCKGAFTTCARFMVSDNLGGGAVPADLFPHQADRAAQLIRQ
jgi:hypothetical protein